MFDSRQLAIVIWTVVFIMWALSQAKVRPLVFSLLRSIFSRPLLPVFFLILAWNVAVVWWLERIGFWDTTMLYDTVVFVAIGGIGAVSKASPSGTTFDRRFFMTTILVNLEFMVLFVFLSDFFPFNFWVEFLFVVPFMTVLVVLVMFSGTRKEYEQTHRFLSGVQSFVGILLICYVLWQTFSHYRELASVQVLHTFLLPAVMSLFFMPVLFVTCTDFAYQSAFGHLPWGDDEVRKLLPFKRRRLVRRFGLNLSALQGFCRSRVYHEYRWAKSNEDAKSILESWDVHESDGVEAPESV